METLILEKRDGRYDLRPLLNYLTNQKDGTFRIEVTKVRGKRSNEQNAWLWGCIYPLMLVGLNGAGWGFASIEQVHEFCKAQFNGERVVNADTGEVFMIPSSTAQMDTLTFATYCDKLREYGREFLGIEIPEPAG